MIGAAPSIASSSSSSGTLKDDEVYLHDYETVPEAVNSLTHYFHCYNEERLHQALGDQSPAPVFAAAQAD